MSPEMRLDLEDLLAQTWPRVRKRHLFPELPPPRYASAEERVGLDIKVKTIFISREFVLEMAEVLEAETVLEGLLDHAVSHYLSCPWDFSTHLKLYLEAKRVLGDKNQAQKATDYFMDVVADTHCVSHKETPLPRLYRHLKRSSLDEAVHALYQRIWALDLGVSGHEETARKLSRLPYLDRRRWPESLRRFAAVLQPLLEKEAAQDRLNRPSPMGRHKVQQYPGEEIEKGLKDLAFEAASLREFKDIVQDWEEEILEAAPSTGRGMGLGPGRGVQADLLYYMKLAENYQLPLRKTPMEKSGALYPHHHVPWEVSRPYQDIDPWTSLGKIMPGLTQTWQRLEGEVFGPEDEAPDCIVLIDSSGSMTNPRHYLSHAVLGAACACEAYLRNEARVAVYNFSDAYAGGRLSLPYTRQRSEIYGALCQYFGGGTKVRVKDIEALQTEAVPDIFLITDMQITNLQALIEYFNTCENRVTAVHIGDNQGVQTFRRSMEIRPNVGIYAVEKKEDILGIVLGRVREYLYTGSLKRPPRRGPRPGPTEKNRPASPFSSRNG